LVSQKSGSYLSRAKRGFWNMKKILRAQFFSARVNFPMIVMSAMKRRPMSGGIGTLEECSEHNPDGT